MTDPRLPMRAVQRSYPLDDITIRSDGSGRTVEAYAAVFHPKYARGIRDVDGHYNEVLHPASFNKTIADNGTRFGVFYNHARTLAGTPDGSLSVPIGVPVEVRATKQGVWTATQYLDNPLADSVLDAIKRGAIRGQSFSGRFVASERSKPLRGETLPTITRHEVAMREYGPTVFPAYADAEVLGVRSFIDALETADPDDRDRLAQLLGLATPLRTAPDEANGTPDGAAEPSEPQRQEAQHSARQSTAAERRAQIARLAHPYLGSDRK